ncbi:TraB/GumN family protein [Sphingomonas sp. NSE70-1]|uniref:TraB/GumN family protein n=1 Tax=Sphingomonas caseinilyticus TaxID=2908205 RepID=A0ABT0RST5_9SPHN|nr:TraB/GumN family protein [Sphingomonas caseinilyticus]MCL6697898.1 TraB/GumN family protein [Sphingomonas caseinilyticus]
MKNFRLWAATAALCFAAPVAAATPALPDADPAMWKVADEDTTIYLFGTFHALDGKSDWFNDEVKAAFDKSDELVIEALVPEDPGTMQPIVMKYALDSSGKPLSSKLSPEGQKQLAAGLAAMGAPPTAFDKFKPFFASLTFAAVGMQKMGLAADKGAEQSLRSAAKTAGKPVSAIEDVEFQIGMFDRIPEAEQLAMLEELLKSMDEIPTEMAQLLSAWNRGDAESFKAFMDKSEGQGPAAYKVIFSDRNATWAEWIDKRLDKPGTVFMAVGTGHLAGKDSVQQMLEQRKIKAVRAN